jgi:pyrophosphate--fructose-6-phosphate 1-phosphotransferase
MQQARADYRPQLPNTLRGSDIYITFGLESESVADREEIRQAFPQTYGQRVATLSSGKSDLTVRSLQVGVLLSGGPAAGGHNVIAGLFDALKIANTESRLFGFLGGAAGVVRGDYREITDEVVDLYRNTGGFDMIMTGRDKIETPEDLCACQANLAKLGLDGLVIIGGDDSNTNAAVLAEYLLKQGSAISIIGVPKTIDGDLRNDQVEITFGYDTACKVYSDLIGNICRDAVSVVKYWHFIRLMGRSASQVALECALKTCPNIALISEEVQTRRMTLEEIVDQIVDVVVARFEAGKDYGVLVVPEGLPEFIPDISAMIDELSTILGTDEKYLRGLPDHTERVQYLSAWFTDHSARVYSSLPEEAQEVLLTRDSHGNVPLSQVETERLLIDLVGDRIRRLNSHRSRKIIFNPLSHFFGYEGRCAAPSNFDANYAYSLGFSAAQLVRAGLTGYTASIHNLVSPPGEWIAGGTPITMMMCIETRKGSRKPVIKRSVVDLDGAPFRAFDSARDEWAVNDSYSYPGPIQYFGPAQVCDAPPVTLALEHKPEEMDTQSKAVVG